MGTYTTNKSLYKPAYKEVQYHTLLANSLDIIDAGVMWLDGSLPMTGNLDGGDAHYMKIDQVRAYDAAGLKLYDDGGNGIFVKDGGDVGFGTILPDAQVDITKAAANATMMLSCFHDTEATTPLLTLRKADNTEASPALVDDNAVLGTIAFSGYDGAAWRVGARIEVRVDGTPASDDMPSEITFWTTPSSAASLAQRITISPAGNVGIGTATFGANAAASLAVANGTAPTSSIADQIEIFSVDIGAAATLGLRTEAAVAADADETKFSNKLSVKINGTDYFIMLTTT